MFNPETEVKKVDFTDNNVATCRCVECPVQSHSSCATNLMSKLESQEDPSPEQFPGLYCSSGKASCEDIEVVKNCLCTGCMVWAEYELTSNHYCAWGSEKERPS